jgi:hypothetical protein
MYDEQMENQEDVLRSLTELVPEGPLLPNLQGLRWGIRPRPIRDFDCLLIHSICAIQLSWCADRSGDEYKEHSIEGQHEIFRMITERVTNLSYLGVIDPQFLYGYLSTRTLPQQFRLLSLGKSKADSGSFVYDVPCNRASSRSATPAASRFTPGAACPNYHTLDIGIKIQNVWIARPLVLSSRTLIRTPTGHIQPACQA